MVKTFHSKPITYKDPAYHLWKQQQVKITSASSNTLRMKSKQSLNSHSNVIVVKASMNMLTPTDVIITQSLENVPSTVVV